MQKKILLLMSALVVFSIVQAADGYWTDINFTRDSVLWGQGTTPPQPNYQEYQNREFFNGNFIIQGFFGRFAVSTRKVNNENLAENFIISWRLSTSASNQLVFPKYDNIGRLKIQFYNVNPNIGGSMRVQYNNAPFGETAVWTDFDPALELSFPADNGSTSSSVIDTLLNLGPTQLRIAPAKYGTGTGNKWLQVYAVTISKNMNSGVHENLMSKFEVKQNGRLLNIKSDELEYSAIVYDLAGEQLGTLKKNISFTFTSTGVYIVRITTVEGTFAKKIAIF